MCFARMVMLGARLGRRIGCDLLGCQTIHTLLTLIALSFRYSHKSAQGAASVIGVLRLLVSTTPCLSCTCAFQQFRLLLPNIRVEFAQLKPWEVPGTYGGAPQEQVERERA